MKLMLHPYSVVKEKEYYRLITSDFVHHDFMHLCLNELMIFAYCANLEQYLNKTSPIGSWEFLLIYVTSCVAGGIGVTIIHRKSFDYSSAGASGSVIGCLFSYTILQPDIIAFYLPGLGPIKNLYFGLICIVAFIVYQWRTKNDLVNHEVHFFSALGGIFITLFLFHYLK